MANTSVFLSPGDVDVGFQENIKLEKAWML